MTKATATITPKKQKGLISKATTLLVQHTFLLHFLAVTPEL